MNDLVLHRIDRKAVHREERGAFTGLARALAATCYEAAQQVARPLVVLHTCERFEVYSSNGVSLEPRVGTLPGVVTRTAGIDAVRHLFRVAAGLESRIAGEPQVLGQVRRAFAEAAQHGTTDPEFARAFSAAIRCGRRVRALAGFGAADRSYAAHAVACLRGELSGLGGRHVGIVGCGELAVEIARAIYAEGGTLTIIGRHPSRAASAAASVGGRWLGLPAILDSPRPFDALVTAVSCADPVIGSRELDACGVRLVIDLGAAPNVDPRCRETVGLRLIGLDDLGGSVAASESIQRATAIVEGALVRYLASQGSSRVGPVTVLPSLRVAS